MYPSASLLLALVSASASSAGSDGSYDGVSFPTASPTAYPELYSSYGGGVDEHGVGRPAVDEHGGRVDYVGVGVTLAAIVACMSCVAVGDVVRQRARASEAARRLRDGAPRVSEAVRREQRLTVNGEPRVCVLHDGRAVPRPLSGAVAVEQWCGH